MNIMNENSASPSNSGNEARAHWLRLLALSDPEVLKSFWSRSDISPDFAVARAPEFGLTMVRGRAGGTGAAFNLGEMSITRCAVSMTDSQSKETLIGVGYVAGRDKEHAEFVAKFDAVMQDSGWGSALREKVVPRLDELRRAKQTASNAKTAATRVDFFTMERGR